MEESTTPREAAVLAKLLRSGKISASEQRRLRVIRKHPGNPIL